MKAQDCEKTSLKKGSWSPEEDQKLIAYIGRYGIWNWSEMPKFAGLLRCGKSCRLRWMNYLRPDINHGNFTQEEDETIIKLHQELGNRWSKIASRMPGRTDNDIKNHWHSRLKKGLIKNNHVQETQTASIVAPGESNLEGCKVMSTPTSPQLCTDNFSSSGSDSAVTRTEENYIFSETYPNFWELPFTEDQGLCLMDGFGLTFTDPGFVVSFSLSGLEDDVSPSAFYGDDLWS